MVFICVKVARMLLRLACVLLPFPLVLSFTACSVETPAAHGRVRVAAALFPLAWAAERVGGARVAVTDLTPPGVEPHDLELDPTSVAAVARADFVLYIGGSFQPAVSAAAADAAGRSLDITEEATRNFHVWLDPVAMRGVVERVATGLAGVDPSGTPGYIQRARRTREQLGRLARAYSRSLRYCERRVIFTSHAAFGGLAARYGLTQVAIARDPEAEPPPRRLVTVIDKARAGQATTIFAERSANRRTAEVVAAEVGAETATLDTVESPPTSSGYLTSMRNNLGALVGALGCR